MPEQSGINLYLFRHGETQWSISGQHTGRSNIPLTEHGRSQAQALQPQIQGFDFSMVLVSPLQRARDTATLAGLTEHVQVCPDLMEVDYGDYEGLTLAQIREKVPGWTIWTHPCPGGETIEQAAKRCQRVIDTACGATGKVAVVAHGHILRILTTVWLDSPASNGKHFMLDTGKISILSHEHENRAILTWNGRL